MQKRILIVPLAIVVIIGALLVSRSSKADLADAEKVAEGFYGTLMARDFESTKKLLHAAFLESTSFEELCKGLDLINSDLGNITSYKRVDWHTTTFITTSGISTRIIFTYEVTRTKCNSTEIVTVFKSVSSSFLVLKYNVDSPD